MKILETSSAPPQTAMLQGGASSSSALEPSRKRRSHGAQLVNVGFLEHLDAGTWYLALYNDAEQYENIEIVTSITSK